MTKRTIPTSLPAAPRRCLVAMVATVALLAASAALAQSPLFVPGGDMDLFIGGALDPSARIYESAPDAVVLVVSDRLPSPVVLHVRSRGVQAVPKARLQETERGLVLLRGEALQSLGNFEVVKTDIQ